MKLETCDKHIFDSLRSKSVYKEEKQELSKTLAKIFEKYHVNSTVVNKRLKLINNLAKKSFKSNLKKNHELPSIAQESCQERTSRDESKFLKRSPEE